MTALSVNVNKIAWLRNSREGSRWDLSDPAEARRVAETVARYRARGVRVSLFMDPVAEQIARAKECGADRIELYTGPYADLAAAQLVHVPFAPALDLRPETPP